MRFLFAAALVGSPMTWDFQKDEPGKLPAGFVSASTAETPPGKWVVEKDGPRLVLAQLDQSRVGKRFAMAVVKDSSYRDLRLSVRGKPISGNDDQSVGLVWRYQDQDNYYVARSNVLERNVRLYRVVNGNRIKFAGKENLALEAKAWHALKVEHRGPAIRVFLNDEMLFEAKDETFAEAGKVGVWVKADSVTYFDDLTAEALP